AKVYSGVSVRDFQKTISFQKITKVGLRNLSETIITLAEAEKLDAHANAVKLRLR
ncbi:MAG: histidinol dehydrogenase, partial [Rhodothermaceae bacterium]